MHDALIPLEFDEQIVVVQYLELMDLKFTSIPKSTFTKFKKEKWKNMVSGLRPGLPDLLIMVSGKLLFIEMKRVKTGKVSQNQTEWIEALRKVENVIVEVCYGADEAIEVINKYK